MAKPVCVPDNKKQEARRREDEKPRPCRKEIRRPPLKHIETDQAKRRDDAAQQFVLPTHRHTHKDANGKEEQTTRLERIR